MLQKRHAPCPIGFPTAQNQTIKSWDCEIAEVVSLLPSSNLSFFLAWSHLYVPSPPFFSNISTFYFQKKKHVNPPQKKTSQSRCFFQIHFEPPPDPGRAPEPRPTARNPKRSAPPWGSASASRPWRPRCPSPRPPAAASWTWPGHGCVGEPVISVVFIHDHDILLLIYMNLSI